MSPHSNSEVKTAAKGGVCDSAAAPIGPDVEEILTTESFLVNVIADVEWLMDINGISKADLARKMGKTESRVSQIFNGGRGSNLTLRVLGSILHAVGEKDVRITCASLEKARREAGVTHPCVNTASPSLAWFIDSAISKLEPESHVADQRQADSDFYPALMANYASLAKSGFPSPRTVRGWEVTNDNSYQTMLAMVVRKVK